MTTATTSAGEGGKLPLIEGTPTRLMQGAVWAFVIVPFLALVSAVPLAAKWGWGPTWFDAGLAVGLYFVTCSGIGVGYHRYLTHRAFKANRPLKIVLAIAGSLAIQGNVVQWVADHRRHHRYTDQENDPHSPWRYGENFRGLTRGLIHAHVGWLFHRELSNRAKFAVDLLRDKDILVIDRLFPAFVVLSLGGPALVGGLVTWSWWGALIAFFWAGLVRVAVLHHVTWSVNSICHVYGERPFKTKDGDRASNVWWLALVSFGESWHNLHHADPTCARHGVDRGQIDINAWLIKLFEQVGWVTGARWPDKKLAAKRY